MTVYKRCTTNDWALLARLRIAMLEESPQAFNVKLGSQNAQMWQTWANNAHEAKTSLVVFAFHDLAAAGMISAHFVESVVLAGALWVDPRARKQRIASNLIGQVETWAQEIGATCVQVGVSSTNTASQKLFARRSYVKRGDISPTIHGGVETLLRKTLR